MNILKEMNDLGALLEIEAKEKRYEKDHLKKVYEILERQKVLLEAWDEKKEILFRMCAKFLIPIRSHRPRVRGMFQAKRCKD